MNIAVFASGSGSNAENIIRYFGEGDRLSSDGSAIRVALVLCNRPDAYVITRAARLGVPSVVVTRSEFNDRDRLLAIMSDCDVRFIVLAGFLLMVPDFLIEAYPDRILNIHPSLLPKYGGKGMYGMHVHEAVRASGDDVTGITIHRVSPVCDGGEIVFQASVPVLPEDSAGDIARKVAGLEAEHFPRVIHEVIRGH